MTTECTDAQAVIDCATAAAAPATVDPRAANHVVVPEGSISTVLDLDAFLPAPRRKRGTVEIHTADALVQYVRDQDEGDGRTRLFADVPGRTVLAVLNGHAPADRSTGEDDAGWGDHRARFMLRHTPEWTAWKGHDGKLLAQVDFAQHLEDRLDDIVSPPGAELLELAKTFETKTNVDFKSAVVLETGERQLNYQETTDARAGQDGRIVIPKEFVLGIRPFEGSEPYRITARLRYRVNNGTLGIGFQLIRAEEVLRTAVNDAVEVIERGVTLTAIRGVPAA